MNLIRIIVFKLAFLSNILTASAYAPRVWSVNVGTARTPMQVISTLIGSIAEGAVWFIGAIFMIGTLFVVMSFGKESTLQKGKDLMLYALIGLGVILGSYAIMRTFFYVIYIIR
jgi:hypothetical protein